MVREGSQPSKKWAAAAETAEGLERNPGAYRSLKPGEGESVPGWVRWELSWPQVWRNGRWKLPL